MDITELPPPPHETANPAPPRPSASVRRTSSIDIAWPDGPTGQRLFVGRGRDYLTPRAGEPGRILSEAGFRARLAEDKTITAIEGEPADPRLGKLVGVRGGNHLRLFLRENLPELIENGEPIYLPLDDISGTALVSAFAWGQWHVEAAELMRQRMRGPEFEKMMAERVNICWGLQEGNSGTGPTPPEGVGQAAAGELVNPADPQGWHALYEPDEAGFRRARRIDVTRDAGTGLIRIDTAFQDSARKQGEGGAPAFRTAIHEYRISATVDPDTLEILTLEPEARILPFSECPGAILNAGRLVGSRLPDIRDTVLAQLRGPEGCTHLNDAMRALAEVPQLATYLAA